MLTVSIQGNFDQAREEIHLANRVADCIEFRIDLMEKQDGAHLSKLRSSAKVPVIFTIRNKEHGGKFEGNEKEREEKFLELLPLKPDYIDIEWDAPFTLDGKVIVSYHNFKETPEHLDKILEKMRMKRGVIYKLATYANSSIDALRILSFVKENNDVAGMCMGEKGEITRILAPIVGAPLIYTHLGKETAIGQVSLPHLQSLYHFKRLNRSTKIYALIGDPVKYSVGHLVHNHQFQKEKVDGVYVKIPLGDSELSPFFHLLRTLPFEGISVTMPLKEKVGIYLDLIDPDAEKMGAINTLVKKGGKWFGLNTDGKGALNALEKEGKVQGKIVLILGAGGAARGVAFEAVRRGGKVVIANRTYEKGKRLADKVGGSAVSFEAIDTCPYDFIINTTSVGLGDPVGKTSLSSAMIRQKSVALDLIIHPKKTRFLDLVLEKGGKVIYGSEMFAHQALGQLRAWNIPVTSEREFFSFIEALPFC